MIASSCTLRCSISACCACCCSRSFLSLSCFAACNRASAAATASSFAAVLPARTQGSNKRQVNCLKRDALYSAPEGLYPKQLCLPLSIPAYVQLQSTPNKAQKACNMLHFSRWLCLGCGTMAGVAPDGAMSDMDCSPCGWVQQCRMNVSAGVPALTSWLPRKDATD